MTTTTTHPARPWSEVLAPYKHPSTWRSVWQLLTSLVPFGALWGLMLLSLQGPYWMTLVLAIPASLFLVRLFIIQHDCGHGSFFKSRRLNDRLGFLIGVLTLTPYGYWRKTHAIHHATSGNLDHRTFGDVETLTVKEYLALSRWGRMKYRLYRNPLVLFGIGPAWQFLLKHRCPWDLPLSWKREWASVMWANLAIVGILLVAWQTIGIKALMLVHLPIALISGAIGVWLFYIQHQFEDGYWRHDEEWSYDDAGLQGSSYYDLPRILHWFTGNIGVHHVHHLSSRIPNYNLRKCFRENAELQRVRHLTLWESLKCARLKLWDEERHKFVRFGSELRAAARGNAA